MLRLRYGASGAGPLVDRLKMQLARAESCEEAVDGLRRHANAFAKIVRAYEPADKPELEPKARVRTIECARRSRSGRET